MSGGFFDWAQYRIDWLRDEIDDIIKENQEKHGFSDATIKELKNAVSVLRMAYVYTNRIDWLMSGDDGEESFRDMLAEEISLLQPESMGVQGFTGSGTRPKHYRNGQVECIDAIRSMLSEEELRGYYRGNVAKYLWRYRHKGQIGDLMKAEVYLGWLVQLEAEEEEAS
jgi:hypothetical protein